ncbi:ATP-binding protein [Achromobacter sp. UMC46]|uniref:ATP-binding protein n=1 Tax=Achromobacter sp. UMC46 TaxID=1862319 RepID=UPI001603DA56|nr:ATP-binding protein [Achromobacter sp. UMC46]MBB1596882.1 hypothetical protein [Achromobacter sp. UMC46]
MSLTYLEASLIGVAALLFCAAVSLLRIARRAQAEARGLRALATQADASTTVQTQLLDATPTLIAALDGTLRYLRVNQAFEELVGMDRTRLVGAKASSLEGAAGALGTQLEAFAKRCLATQQMVTEEIKVHTAHGPPIDGRLTVEPLYGEDRAPAGTLIALADVTGRRAAERETRELKAAIDDLIDTLPLGLFRIREEPDGRRSVPYAVGHTERFLLLTAAEITQLSTGDNLPSVLKTHWPAARVAIDESKATGNPIRIDLPTLRPEGEGWLRIGTAAPRRYPDGSIEWNGYLADVMREHRATTALNEAKAAAEANAQAKSRFLAAMSHEIRTPLATALGALELLGDTRLDDYQRQQVDLADSASRLLIEILGDILDFSRLEDAPVAIETIPYSLRELLDQVLHIFSSRALAKGLTLDLHVAPEVAAEFVGDPVRVKQIVLNLVGNAIKFTSAGGVAVMAETLPDHASAGMQTVLLSVADTGIGIPLEAQGRLFRPFSQADVSTARQYGGSGLGLAICLRLAHLMSGGIQVESVEGQGSRFDVRLPMHLGQSAPADAALNGKRLSLSVRREADNAALCAYARTAGMLVVGPGDDADLHIVEPSGEPPPSSNAPRPLPHILFTSRPTSTPAATTTQSTLAGGPVRWSEFRRVCLSALQTEHLVTNPLQDARENAQLPATGRILVVEDHLPYQIVIRNMLQKLGVQADVVADGHQALGQLEQVPYALMFTDFHMPDMDGFELTRRVRSHADPRIRSLPVVALSADVSSEHMEHFQEVGLNDFLIKPVNLATLRACLEKWSRP